MFLKHKVKKCDILNKKYKKPVKGALFYMLNDECIWAPQFKVGKKWLKKNNITPFTKKELFEIVKLHGRKVLLNNKLHEFP